MHVEDCGRRLGVEDVRAFVGARQETSAAESERHNRRVRGRRAGRKRMSHRKGLRSQPDPGAFFGEGAQGTKPSPSLIESLAAASPVIPPTSS